MLAIVVLTVLLGRKRLTLFLEASLLRFFVNRGGSNGGFLVLLTHIHTLSFYQAAVCDEAISPPA